MTNPYSGRTHFAFGHNKTNGNICMYLCITLVKHLHLPYLCQRFVYSVSGTQVLKKKNKGVNIDFSRQTGSLYLEDCIVSILLLYSFLAISCIKLNIYPIIKSQLNALQISEVNKIVFSSYWNCLHIIFMLSFQSLLIL